MIDIVLVCLRFCDALTPCISNIFFALQTNHYGVFLASDENEKWSDQAILLDSGIVVGPNQHIEISILVF